MTDLSASPAPAEVLPEYSIIGISSITGYAVTAICVLFVYTIYACGYEKFRLSNPGNSSFKSILIFVAASVTFLIVLHYQVRYPALETPCFDQSEQCRCLSSIWCNQSEFERCPCVCEKAKTCGNKDFTDENGRSCFWYDGYPEDCTNEALYECCACSIPEENNHTWRDVNGRSCVYYKIYSIYCGGSDPSDEQTSWDACPTFCIKSDIIGDVNWVDTRGLSCIFYQEETWHIVPQSDGRSCNSDSNSFLILDSGSAFCGGFDGDIPAYTACKVCQVSRECQPDREWRTTTGLGCLSFGKNAYIADFGVSECGVDDKDSQMSSWDACPCFCNKTQKLLEGYSDPGWSYLGRGCASYEMVPELCGSPTTGEAWDACPACNTSLFPGNITWRPSGYGSFYNCLWFENDPHMCWGLAGANENCDLCMSLGNGNDVIAYDVHMNEYPWLSSSQLDVYCWVSDYVFLWDVYSWDVYSWYECTDIQFQMCRRCRVDFSRLNNSKFGRVEKDLCIRGVPIIYFRYNIIASDCFSFGQTYNTVVGIGWNTSASYCSLHSLKSIDTFEKDWYSTTVPNNQPVDCFIRIETNGFCTEPTFRETPSPDCNCTDGYPCIFAYGSNCTVACEDSSGLTKLSGPTVEVVCKCQLGICGKRHLTDWELYVDGANHETIFYFGDESSNGWIGTDLNALSCVHVDCQDFLGCLSNPTGIPLDNETCSYYNFYNTFAAGLGGFCILLISFTGLARRDNADNITLCLQCKKDFDETILEQKERERQQNYFLRFKSLNQTILQVFDYGLDIWCAVDYWAKDRHVLSYLIAATIVFQICTTTITKHPWTEDEWVIPGIFYLTGFGLVHESFLCWNLNDSTLDLTRMVFISSLTEDVPSVAINISEIILGNYWPLLQSLSILTSMAFININFLKFLSFYHSRTLVITTGYSLLFIGAFTITDEIVRVVAVFGILLKADLIPGVALVAANLALGACFGWVFSKHSSHRLGYLLMYTLTLPLSGVLGLFALLLNEANGNIFIIEYFTRLCLNVGLFSISCWGEGVEKPQQDVFTIVLWMNVICFIGVMATLSKMILRKSRVHWNVLSMHEIDPNLGILYIPSMFPSVRESNAVFDRESVKPPNDRAQKGLESNESLVSYSEAEENEQYPFPCKMIAMAPLQPERKTKASLDISLSLEKQDLPKTVVPKLPSTVLVTLTPDL